MRCSAKIILTGLLLCAGLGQSWAAGTYQQQAKGRVVHFPKDRSLGRLMIQDEGTKRHISTFHFWTTKEDIDCEYLCEATGDVVVPAGKRLRLNVSQRGASDLSPLLELGPDDLYRLSIPEELIS